jgi:hypothetical protein
MWYALFSEIRFWKWSHGSVAITIISRENAFSEI